MTKFLAIDYGLLRTGLSITDSDKIFAYPLETIETNKLINHLSTLIENENISRIIIGQPKRFSGQNSEIESSILKFIDSISNIFDKKQIFRYDERFTSKIAKKYLKIRLNSPQRAAYNQRVFCERTPTVSGKKSAKQKL